MCYACWALEALAVTTESNSCPVGVLIEDAGNPVLADAGRQPERDWKCFSWILNWWIISEVHVNIVRFDTGTVTKWHWLLGEGVENSGRDVHGKFDADGACFGGLECELEGKRNGLAESEAFKIDDAVADKDVGEDCAVVVELKTQLKDSEKLDFPRVAPDWIVCCLRAFCAAELNFSDSKCICVETWSDVYIVRASEQVLAGVDSDGQHGN